MNKKHRFVLGFSVVAVLLIYLALTSGVTANQYNVSEAVAAKQNLTDKIINVNGSLVTGSDKWDSLNRTLTFKMTDGIATIDVIYTGDKPNIPPQYTDIQVVATGQFDNNVFRSYKMLTKCPSEYEGAEKVSNQS